MTEDHGSPPNFIGPQLDEAVVTRQMGSHVPAGTRLRAVKQLMVRGARVVTHDQVKFNEAVIAALGALDHEVGEMERRSRIWIAGIEASHAEVLESVDRISAHLANTGEAEIRAELSTLRARVEALLDGASGAGTVDPATAAEVRCRYEHGLGPLYAAFEERFRGSRKEIKRRLGVYTDVIDSFAGVGGRVVDIGAGRGEWLEILTDRGIDAYGVDTNEELPAEVVGLGLEVVHADALGHLRTLPDRSLAGVTGFHIIEHLDFEYLVDLVDECVRTLRPGGVVLFETPNTLNVTVGAAGFWIDPTHKRPVHPLFLDFLMQDRGFGDVEIRYVNEPEEPPFVVPRSSDTDSEEDPKMARIVERLNRLIYTAMDYAVIAECPDRPE
ncbi:MAG: methyltransferase domain-containing protein [Acidimicrobiia bacterium]|nr:methyltransferase domain-containing protein [Acidimicrobiia bacterium]